MSRMTEEELKLLEKINHLEAEIAGLRKAVESARDRLACNSVKHQKPGDTRCHFKDYGRHSSDCMWDVAAELDAALKGAGDDS